MAEPPPSRDPAAGSAAPGAGAEPSAVAAPGAGAEPSAVAEPSAAAEPSAVAEPSAGAGAEPSAVAEPSAAATDNADAAAGIPGTADAVAAPGEAPPIEWPDSVSVDEPPAYAPLPRHTPWLTFLLAGVNLAVWGITIAAGAHVFSPTPQKMFELGGNLGVVTLEGEEWRLLTSMFLHLGLVHVAANLIGLIGGGTLVERLYGRFGLATIYLISGLAASITTALRPGVVSVGASGAIFGMFGALGAFYIRYHDRMGPEVAKHAVGVLAFIAYNMVFGFSKDGVDMYAHIGGLIAGFVCGFALGGNPPPLAPVARDPADPADLAAAEASAAAAHASPAAGPPPSSPAISRRARLVAGIGLVIVVSAAFLAPAPHSRALDAARAFAIAEQLLERGDGLIGQAQAGERPKAEVADVLEREILPRWRDVQRKFDEIDAGRRYRRVLFDYMRAREQGWELIAQGLRSGDDETMQRGFARLREGDALVNKLSQ